MLDGVISHIWNFAGSGNDGSGADINLLVAQPFINYNYFGGYNYHQVDVELARYLEAPPWNWKDRVTTIMSGQ